MLATVKNIKSPEDRKVIKIITEVDYPDLPTDSSDEILIEKFVYRLPDKKDDIQYLLDFANVSSPSELVGESVPIKPESYTKRNDEFHNITYNIHKPKDTIWSKLKHVTIRIMMKLRMFERGSHYSNELTYGEYILNKNFIIWLSIITSPFLLTKNVFLLLPITLGLYYLTLVSYGLIRGLYDYIVNEEGDRLYIKQKIEK